MNNIVVIVTHVKNLRSSFEEPPTYNGSEYEMVATVSVPEDYPEIGMLETAFERTNTIDHAWWENPEVTKLFKTLGCRSTSTGDVVILPGNRPFRVEGCGWSRLVDGTWTEL